MAIVPDRQVISYSYIQFLRESVVCFKFFSFVNAGLVWLTNRPNENLSLIAKISSVREFAEGFSFLNDLLRHTLVYLIFSRSQIDLLSLILYSFDLQFNDDLWLLYLYLKAPSVIPMYVWGGMPSSLGSVAW